MGLSASEPKLAHQVGNLARNGKARWLDNLISYDGGKRPFGIPTVKDRVRQLTLRNYGLNVKVQIVRLNRFLREWKN